MGYYEDKVPGGAKYDPRPHLSETAAWIEELQDELKKAGRQIDKLDRKLRIRSRKLGAARAELNPDPWYPELLSDGPH